MNRRSKMSLAIPVLALSMTLAAASSLHAQDRYESRSGLPATFQVNFGSAPHWTSVNGTQVQIIRQDERPDYDMFRYNNRYYAYNNNRWYSSDQWRGPFTYVDINGVPIELSQVPRDNWRQYPYEWQDRSRYDDRNGDRNRYDDRNGDRDRYDDRNADRNRYDDRNGYRNDDRNYDPQGTYGTFPVTFGNRRPRWNAIPGTGVMVVRQGQRQPYDMFRYGNRYYVYDHSRWYWSNRWDGNFSYVDDRSVPRELYRVPRQHWRNYPEGWATRRDGRYDNRRR